MKIRTKLLIGSILFSCLFVFVGGVGVLSSRDVARKSLLLDRMNELLSIHTQITQVLYQAQSATSHKELNERTSDLEEYHDLFMFGLGHLHQDLARVDGRLAERFVTQVSQIRQKGMDIINGQRLILEKQMEIERLVAADAATANAAPRLETGSSERALTGTWRSVGALDGERQSRLATSPKFRQAIEELEQVSSIQQRRITEFQEWSEMVVSIAMEIPHDIRNELMSRSRDALISELFLIGFIVVSLTITVTMSIIFSRFIYRPIEELTDAVREIEDGNLDVQVNPMVAKQSEFGNLAKSFNRMAAKLKKQTNELEAAKQLAEDANHAKSNFLGCMSHELRTPLNAVIGYGELLGEEIRDLGEEHLVDDVDKITTAGRHLLHLINQVLDLEKIEANKLELEWKECDLQTLLADIVNTTQQLVEKNSNQFEIVNEYSGSTLLTDELRLRQVLINLIGNASKFTEDGTVRLRISEVEENDEAALDISVEDTGIGMNQAQLEKIFDAFSQADISTTRQYGGTGLGLTISRELVERMGGSIRVASTVGKGTTFTVRLPLHPASPLV